MSKLLWLFLIMNIQTNTAGCLDCLLKFCKSKPKTEDSNTVIHGQLLIASKNIAYESIKDDPNLKKIIQNSNVILKDETQLMIPILAFSALNEGKTAIWSEGIPKLDNNNNSKRFVRYLPYAILAHLKEGHHLNLIWNNKPIRLKCSQKRYMYDAKSFHIHLENYREQFNWPKHKHKVNTSIN